uniref:F-box domain-containing protein n=1 Tax=Meloidogyne enterolobii TaxID=390850 RepID=A0A6V7TQT3_MELEN|nr:unnamed protein product [Meloidogyne enterolobii]
MFSLSLEVQLDILERLNYDQLISVRQTNFYFYNLINKYEGELARMKLNRISIIDLERLEKSYSYKFIQPGPCILKFTLNNQLKKKWQTAIDKSIPLSLFLLGSLS